MAITICSEALLAAARTQRVLTCKELVELRSCLDGQPLRTPHELRDWLANSHLPVTQVANLVELLPPPGRDFTPYRTLAHLATGGMGAIWLAASPADHLVVVKTLIDGAAGDGAVATDSDGDVWILEPPDTRPERPGSDALQRLERETRITRSLDHPHVVRCLDQGLTSDGQMFLVLEHMASGDLLELLTDHGQLSELLTLSLARQVSAALAVAHHHHLLHRDVKPGNIFLAADGHAKLADFGFARSNQANRTQLTLAGSILGSPLYMAPEQVSAHLALDIRCDLYGLGCVMFHCLAGAPPYCGSMHAVMRAHCTAPVPDISRLRPGLLPETVALINHLLQKAPVDRPANPLAVEATLRQAMTTLGADPLAVVPLPLDTLPVTTHEAESTTCRVPLRETTELPTPSDTDLVTVVADTSTTELGDCLELTSDCGVHLYCLDRAQVIFGKLRSPSVDVCLRNYPEAQHRAACNAISRRHFALRLSDQHVTLEDLGSANGTLFDGCALPASQPLTITDELPHQLLLAHTIQLTFQVWKTGSEISSVTFNRPNNHHQLLYAVIRQQATIGGIGCECVVPGADGSVQVGRSAGRWVHRTTATEPWQALHCRDTVRCGSLRLRVRAGSAQHL